jgi:tol-pal system protein YbgF
MAGRRRALLLAILLLGGCAHVQDVTGVATQQDLLQLQTDVTIAQQRAQRALGEAEAALAATQRRERERDTDTEQRLTALAQRVEALTGSVNTLSGQVDELNGKVDALSRQRAAAPPPTAVPRTAGPPPPSTPLPTPSTVTPPTPSTATPVTPSTATPVTPSTATPVTPPAATTAPGTAAAPPTAMPVAPEVASRPTTNPLQPQDIYQAAYLDFSKGSYALAIAGFREFLRRFPDQPLAGAAQYWIGEAQFALARGFANAGQAPQATEALELAVQEFRKVLANYPRSDKAPASLYKEALVLLELKQNDAAQQRLQYLVETFPQSEESSLARERLAALRPR